MDFGRINKIIEQKSLLESERIVLRPFFDSDAKDVFRYASDPDIGLRAGWPPHKSENESLEVIRTLFNNDTTWAIVLKETGEVIGAMGYGPSCDCGFNDARPNEPTCGYWVGKPFWNKGICTEALQLMLNYVRNNTDIKSFISGHFVDNPASGRVMEKCGFKPLGKECFSPQLYASENRAIRLLRFEF